jgi:hypothetical protein
MMEAVTKALPALKDFIDYWFDHIRQTQGQLRQCEDIFIQNEIQLIDNGRHDYEYEIMPPFMRTPIGFLRKKRKTNTRSGSMRDWLEFSIGLTLARRARTNGLIW